MFGKLFKKSEIKEDDHLAKVGDVVIYVQCDGCMASEHNIKWIGKVIGMKKYTHSDMIRSTEVICEVLKEGHLDWRDAPLGYKFFTKEDTSAQKLAENLIVIFK